jgi:hypothetical protein
MDAAKLQHAIAAAEPQLKRLINILLVQRQAGRPFAERVRADDCLPLVRVAMREHASKCLEDSDAMLHLVSGVVNRLVPALPTPSDAAIPESVKLYTRRAVENASENLRKERDRAAALESRVRDLVERLEWLEKLMYLCEPGEAKVVKMRTSDGRTLIRRTRVSVE